MACARSTRDLAASTSAAARWLPRYCDTTSSTLSSRTRGLLGARAVDARLAGAIAAPERQIQDRRIEVGAELLITVGPHVLGKAGEARNRWQTSRLSAVDGLAGVAADLRQEGGARDIAILFALRHTQVGQNHARILLERQLDGVAQGELEGRRILGKSAGGERQ